MGRKLCRIKTPPPSPAFTKKKSLFSARTFLFALTPQNRPTVAPYNNKMGLSSVLALLLLSRVALGAPVLLNDVREGTVFSNAILNGPDKEWSPNNASCAAQAVCALPALIVSDVLIVSGFGFNLPADAVILSVNASFSKRSSVVPTTSIRGMQVLQIGLLPPGAPVSPQFGWDFNFNTTFWTTSWEPVVFPLPGKDVLWKAGSWLNSNNVSTPAFRLMIRVDNLDIQSATAYIKCVQVGITYLSDPGTASTSGGGSGGVGTTTTSSSPSGGASATSSTTTTTLGSTGRSVAVGTTATIASILVPEVSAPNTAPLPSSGEISQALIVAVALAVILCVLLTVGAIKFMLRRRSRHRSVGFAINSDDVNSGVSIEVTTSESPSPEHRTMVTRASSTIREEPERIETYGVQIGMPIGSGQHGAVYKGTWNDSDVACKKLLIPEDDTALVNEMRILQSLKNPNVVHVYGLFTDLDDTTQPSYMIMEFVNAGSLDDFLRAPGRKDMLRNESLTLLCTNVAAGMLYVSGRNVVHRDLAARNLLVQEDTAHGNFTVKISDFGMGIELDDGKIYQRMSNVDELVPILHSPPEVILQSKYSTASDVWSFGVVMWEVFSFGETPYDGMDASHIRDTVCSQSHRLHVPDEWPQKARVTMMDCWHHLPDRRPVFKELHTNLRDLYRTLLEDDVSSMGELPHIIRQSDDVPSAFYCDLSEFQGTS